MILVGCNNDDASTNGDTSAWDYPPAIMLDGRLYGPSSQIYVSSQLGDELGQISSVIDGSEGMPQENFQTNAYRLDDPIYAYGDDMFYIAVNCNEKYDILELLDFSLEDYEAIEIGTKQEDVRKRFGNPHGMLSGLYGDIYLLEDKMIIVYYDFDEVKGHPVTEVKVTDKE